MRGSQKKEMLFTEVFLKIPLLAVGGLAFLIGLMLNGSTIFIFSCGKERAIDLMWSLNLAVVDFIFFSLLPLRVWSMVTSFDGLLTLNSGITAVHMVSRAFFLAAMTACCTISVVSPAWLGKSQAFHWAFVASLVIWALSSAFSMRYDDLWEVLMLFKDHKTGQDEVLTLRSLSTNFLIWFLCLLTLMMMCYSVRTSKQKESYHATSRELRRPFIFLLTFFLGWLPYHILYFLLVMWLEDPLAIISPGFIWMAFLLPYLSCCCDAITMICHSKTQRFESHLQQSDGQRIIES